MLTMTPPRELVGTFGGSCKAYKDGYTTGKERRVSQGVSRDFLRPWLRRFLVRETKRPLGLKSPVLQHRAMCASRHVP